MQPENLRSQPDAEVGAGHPVVAELEAAAQNLLFISETDAPLTPFFWPSAEKTLTPELLAQLAKLPADVALSTQTLAEFFEPATTEEDWMNDDERAEARRFQELAKVLEANLSDTVVYRAGETNVAVYAVGKVEGGFAGVATNVVET